MVTPEQCNGFHAPNRKLVDLEGGPGAFWSRMGLVGAATIKFLYPDHTLDDIKAARRRGMRIIWRAPGEGIVAPLDVLEMIKRGQGYVNAIELGNEPDTSSPQALAKHLDALGAVLNLCAYAARQTGILLIAPGHTARAEPPDPLSGNLMMEWWLMYDRCGAIGAHCYGEYNFDGQLARVLRWQRCWRKAVYITEAGIAAKDLLGVPPDPARYETSMSVKAERYAAFVRSAAGQGVASVAFFIDSGATDEWRSFTIQGQYDPNGTRSYVLSDPALDVLRTAIAQP